MTVHVVDLVVHGKDGFGEAGIGFEEGLDCAADHDADLFAHVGDVDGEGYLRLSGDCLGALGNIGCLVANALEVSVDLDDGEDEAKVDGHGLLFGEEVIGHLVNVALGGIDGGFDLFDVVAESQIASEVGLERERERLLRESSHGKELVLKGDELLLEINPRHWGVPLYISTYSDVKKL